MVESDIRTSAIRSYLRNPGQIANRKWALRTVSVTVFLFIWEQVGQSNFMIAAPSDVLLAAFDQLVQNPTLTNAILSALVQGVIGFLLAVVIGIPIGFLIGFWPFARHVLNPVVDALYVTPMVAFVPLIIIWFGVTVLAKIVFVFFLSVLVVIINTEAGVTETDPGLVDAARVFGASERKIYTEVHLRHSLPYVMNGVRLSGGRAVRGMVIAELFVYAGPLGSYLVNSGAQFEIANLFAAIATLSAIGVIVIRAIERLEDDLLAYRTN